MTRREFCLNNGQGALAIALAPALVLRAQQPIGSRDAAWKRLLADLEQEIEELMTKAQVPGLSIAIVSEGALAWRRSFGIRDIRSKAPVDDNTVFEAASTSKPLFAYVVMKLCETGVLELDTPLVNYVPERVVADDARSDLVTVRHILSHTSGLPNWRSKQEPLAFGFTPGERWAYSGEGYSYLQAVVSRLTGGQRNPASCGRFEAGLEVCAVEPSIDGYMRPNLLEPFGMSLSGYRWTPNMEANIAWGHDPKGQPLKNSRKPSGPAEARYGMAGGLSTTAMDYATFLAEILTRSRLTHSGSRPPADLKCFARRFAETRRVPGRLGGKSTTPAAATSSGMAAAIRGIRALSRDPSNVNPATSS